MTRAPANRVGSSTRMDAKRVLHALSAIFATAAKRRDDSVRNVKRSVMWSVKVLVVLMLHGVAHDFECYDHLLVKLFSFHDAYVVG